jgi:hypothetical protein
MPDLDCFVEVVGPRGLLSDSVDSVLEKGPSTVGTVCRDETFDEANRVSGRHLL